jgi:hypothetical protein
MNFDRVIYRPQEGFPIANELVVNTTSAYNCCGACQETVRPSSPFFLSSSAFPLLLLHPIPRRPTHVNTDATLTFPSPRQPNCAGSFFVPSITQCHIRLTVPANLNATVPTLPSGPGVPGPSSGLATGTSATAVVPSSTASPGTCDRGSDTLYLGTIRGRSPAELTDEFALWFSNGPCGRFSVSPVRVFEG